MSSSTNTTLARPYAKAAFEEARERNTFAQWTASLAALAQLSVDEQVKKLVADPFITAEQKATFFIEILGQHLNEESRNFVHLLAENKRLRVLPEIHTVYEVLRAEHEKTKKIIVVSAAPLDSSHKETLTAALQKKFNSQIEATWQIDENILGGAIIKAGDFVIDGSIRSQLTKLTREMIEG